MCPNLIALLPVAGSEVVRLVRSTALQASQVALNQRIADLQQQVDEAAAAE